MAFQYNDTETTAIMASGAVIVRITKTEKNRKGKVKI